MVDAFDPLTTPSNQSTEVAVVSAIIDGERKGVAVSKGGASFNPGTRNRAGEYDGRRHIASRTIEPVGFGAKISGTFVEFSEKTLGIVMPGSTTAAGIVTPRIANLAFEEGDMLTLPWYQLPLKGGESIVYEFDLGLVEDWSVDTKDNDEATIKIEILAVVDSTRTDYHSKLPDFRKFRLDASGNVIG